MMPLEKIVQLQDETAQQQFSNLLAKASHNSGGLFFLQGDLGAGKTTFARGFLQGLGYVGKVKSPTYTLIETYQLGEQTLLHIDLYRLQHAEEISGLGLSEALATASFALIEWPEYGAQWLPVADVTCYIARLLSGTGRELRLVANTARGIAILQRAVAAWQHDNAQDFSP